MAFYDKLFAKNIKSGTLTVSRPGEDDLVCGTGNPSARLIIDDKRVVSKILTNPGLLFGETYMQQKWHVADSSLTDLLTILRQAFPPTPKFNYLHKTLSIAIQSWNSPIASSKNASHHYNLDDDLFVDFLDSDMHYSCGYFHDADFTLEQAQQAKCEHLRRKLCLSGNQSVLDIGCGWGSLAMYIASKSNANVHGITLSSHQLDVARRRAQERQIDNQVSYELQDFRKQEGCFDAIVSVGMFEHVGKHNYDVFFKTVKRLLRNDGVAVLHTIGTWAPPTPTNPWIRRYIFPGGYIPALSEVVKAIENSGLVIQDTEVWRRHYASTLAHWQKRFQAVRKKWVERKSESFCRMWEFYLSACESAFTVGDLVVFQLQLGHHNAAAPLTRDYLYTPES